MNNNLLRIGALCLVFLSTGAIAQPTSRSFVSRPTGDLLSREVTPKGLTNAGSNPVDPQYPLITLPNAHSMGLANKYPTQSNNGGGHNIQVDPSDPMKMHAVIMGAMDVKATDTSTSNFYPQRNVFYVFSSDGGSTWTTPKQIAPTRAGFPDLILIKRGETYVPVIGLHRYQGEGSGDWVVAIYVEQGAPGAGDFVEGVATRATPTGADRDIIWPQIAASPDGSKVYAIAAVSPKDSTQRSQNILFGTFTLAPGEVTWGGSWKNGPAPTSTASVTNSGYYSIDVSPAGKVGMMWLNRSTGDRSLYYAASNDGGETWPTTVQPVYTDIVLTINDEDNTLMATSIDFFYQGETPFAIFSAQYEDTANNQYYPSSGSLMMWKEGMEYPSAIIQRSNFEHELIGPSMSDAEFLANFPAGTSVDPQFESNLERPSLGRSPISGSFGVVFEAWQSEEDIGFVYDADENELTYTNHSIWYVATSDGGESWSDAVAIKANEIGTEPMLDYRNPQISSYNPGLAGGKLNLVTMFAVDSVAGIFHPGATNWTTLQWFEETVPTPIVVNSVNPAEIGSITLGQNYPNPFNPGTTINFSVMEPTFVVLSVNDMLGREVATLLSEKVTAGPHTIRFAAEGLPTGVYQYTLKAGAETLTRQMILTK